MKVLLVATVLLAVHCTLSQGSLVETLRELVKKAEEKKEAERLFQEKRKEKDEEEELLQKLVEKLKDKEGKRGVGDFFTDLWDNIEDAAEGAQDRLENAGESFVDTIGLNSNEEPNNKYDEEIDLPDDVWTYNSSKPCKKPVLLREDSSGVIDFPKGDDDYPRWENCKWVLDGGSSNKRIKLEFFFMDIRERGDCDDYVEVFAMKCKPNQENEYLGKDLTGKMCAEGIEKVPSNKKSFTINSPCAYIHFRSNMWYSGKGFKLYYTFEN